VQNVTLHLSKYDRFTSQASYWTGIPSFVSVRVQE